MGRTLIEKILLSHTEKKRLENFVYAKVDFCFGNDITAPLAVKIFKEAKFNSVFNPKKIAFVCDHFLPAKDIKSASNARMLKEFAKRFKVNFYDINKGGIEHVFLVEQGFIKPGNLIIGADSHTCTLGALGCAAFGVGSTDLAACMYEGRIWLKVPGTIKFIYKGKRNRWVKAKDLVLYTIGKIGVDGALYKVMEFHDKMVNKLSVEERFTICNMAVEAGAKTGIFEPDKKTLKYLEKFKKIKVNIEKLKSEKNAQYKD
ncbi:MAG: 3-isopropylmalate dehydratase large subunit, partial [Candidatus Omnitrophota bacterium]